PPLDREQLIQLGFIEARGRVLDVAAFLDRVQRATPTDGAPTDALTDDRVKAICDALRLALDGQSERARRILELWSDATTEPAAHADGKAARGVPRKA
ncbi:MAG: hypothetical protein ACKPEA_01510, partial [Planctomycetota bacterium]